MRLICISSSSSGNGYLLTNGKETLIIEMGMPFKEVKKVLDFDISSIVGAVCSHTHGDHFHYHKEYEQAGIDLFTPWKYDKDLAIFGGFRIQAFPVPHNGTPCYGFVIWHKEITGCLIFATDLEYCQFKFDKLKPSTIAIEANYSMDLVSKDAENYGHVLMGHMSIDSACDFIRANQTDGLKNVLLLHLSGRNAKPDLFRELAQAATGDDVNVEVARKGLEIEI